MNMFEEAEAMAGTMALCGITQRELANRLGVSQSCVANKLRLNGFSALARERILSGGLTERHARAILRIDNEEERLELIDTVARRRLTVRECEATVDIRVADRLTSPKIRRDTLSVDGFCDRLNSLVQSLCLEGVKARARTSYYGEKMYITISIDGV